jgi:hypothetical protein
LKLLKMKKNGKTQRLFISLCLTLLSACGFNLPAPRAQSNDGLLIMPLNRSIEARAGAKDSIEFRIHNGLPARTVIDVSLQDLTQDKGGAPILGAIGSTPRTAAPWITIPQGKLSLAPGQDHVIRGTIAIPRTGVSGSYHAALTLQLFGSAAASTGSSAAMVNQTVLPIHVFIAGTLKPAIELESATLKSAAGNTGAVQGAEYLQGKWVLVPRVKNTGNAMARIKGDVIITSQRGELVGRYQVNDGDPAGQAILPGAMIEFPIFLNTTLPDAQYPARINLKFQGARRMEGYSAPMTLQPRSEGSTPEAPLGVVSLGTIERTGLQTLVEPRVVIGSVQPNSIKTQRITITNLEDFPVNVATMPSGLAIDTDGEAIALPDPQVGAWMRVAPSAFRLGPQQSRVVSVRMNAPATLEDRWGLLQFSMSSASKTSDLTATARTSVLLRNAANAETGKAVAQNIALTRSGGGPIVSVTITNPQARPLAFASGALQLLPAEVPAEAGSTPKADDNAPRALVISGESDIVLLPSAARRLDFQLPPNVQPGLYVGMMKLNGIAATGGRNETAEDFSVQFKLNLTAPAPIKDEAEAESDKKDADAKPAAKKVPIKKPAAKK